MSYLREQALSMAAIGVLDDSEMSEPGLELYNAYAKAVRDRTSNLERFSVRRFYVDFEPSDVLALIESRADLYEGELNKALSLAKDGIVDAASEDELSLDLTALDMRSMVERGALL